MRNDWWNPRWLPFTFDGAGNHHCVDLNPAPGGLLGQVVWMWHDDVRRPRFADSYNAWLADIADGLEGDRWGLDEEGNLEFEIQLWNA